MNRLTGWLFNKPSAAQNDIVAALDIGSSKIACFIARADDNGLPRVLGVGHQLSEGVRGGVVSDIELVRRAVAAAVTTAENMAGETIERVTVNVAGPLLMSRTVGVELPAGGREITTSDFDRLVAQGQLMAPEDAQGNFQELIHTLAISHILDGQKGIRDPIGMTGNLLQTQLHLVSAAFGPVRTLCTTIARCHLEVERLVAAPYASGLACLVEDEMDLGSTVIDIGGGTTSIGIFFDGNLIYAGGIAVGGAHITSDIARGLTTSLSNAERMKTLHGNAISSPLDEREMINVPQVGEESPELMNNVPKSHLIRIIKPRLEEIFEMVRSQLEASGLNETAGRRVVLTGGTSQMPGIRDLAQRILDKQVRLGRPLRIARPMRDISADRRKSRRDKEKREDAKGSKFTKKDLFSSEDIFKEKDEYHGENLTAGLAEATSGPAFATTAGLLAVAMQPALAAQIGSHTEYPSGSSGIFGRLGKWVKENL